MDLLSESQFRAESESLGGTWRFQTEAKLAWFDYLDVFWQTPLVSGFREVSYPSDIGPQLWPALRVVLMVVSRSFKKSPKKARTVAARFVVTVFRGLSVLISMGRALFRPLQPDPGGWGLKANLVAALRLTGLQPLGLRSAVGMISGFRLENSGTSKGKVLNHNTLKYASIASDIQGHLVDKERMVILEIGSGFGGLIPELAAARKGNPTVFVLVDLLSSLLVANFYLKSETDFVVQREFRAETDVFTASNLATAGSRLDDMVSAALLEETPTVILASPEAFLGSTFRFDVVVNSESFLEMNSAAVASYFQRIEEGENLIMYNRNRRSRVEEGEKREFLEFPWDSKWKHLETRPCRYSLAIQDTSEEMLVRVSAR